MALSGNPHEKIKIYQAILELAEGIKELNSDPKALQKAVKEAYKLPETEEKKLADSKQIIEQADALLKTQDEKQKKLEAYADELDAKAATIDKKELAVNERIKKNQEKEAELKAINTEQKKLVDDIAFREADLKKGWDQLAKERSVLENTAKEIEREKQSIKDKAKQLKGLAEGL